MKKIFFIPVLFFICFLVVLYLVVPNLSILIKLQNQVENKKIELAEKKLYAQRLKEISAELEKYQEFLDKIEKSLPQDVSIPSLLNFFQEQASFNGLVMKNLNPTESDNDGLGAQTKSLAEIIPDSNTNNPGLGLTEQQNVENVNKVKQSIFGVSVSGSFDSFENFLKSLESSARLIEVKSIEFKEGKTVEGFGDEPKSINFNFDLLIKVFSY